MKKEEILAKSRKENPYADEREQNVMLKAHQAGFYALCIATLVLSFANGYFDLPFADLYVLFAVNGLGTSVYRLIKSPSKTSVSFAIVFLVIFVKAVYEYYLFVM